VKEEHESSEEESDCEDDDERVWLRERQENVTF
jgi:hypothetical protein